jgi:hypothetical protein
MLTPSVEILEATDMIDCSWCRFFWLLVDCVIFVVSEKPETNDWLEWNFSRVFAIPVASEKADIIEGSCSWTFGEKSIVPVISAPVGSKIKKGVLS